MRRLVCVGLAAFVLGGCGGRPALSSQQLRDRAGAICATGAQATGAIPAPGYGNVAAFLDRGVAALGPELTALRAVHPGPDAAPTYRTALDSFAAEVQALDRARARLRAGADPIATVRRLARELIAPEASARRAWTALGISDCLA